MDHIDYYSDRKYCPSCQDYVNYLMSVEQSFCVDCGGVVRLFSKDDWQQFNSTLTAKRPKGGRPRKNSGKDEGRETA